MTDRTKRIREAKAEAQKEIEEYRNQKEEEYKKFEAEVRCRSLEDQEHTAVECWSSITIVLLTSLLALERIHKG